MRPNESPSALTQDAAPARYVAPATLTGSAVGTSLLVNADSETDAVQFPTALTTPMDPVAVQGDPGVALVGAVNTTERRSAARVVCSARADG